MTSKTSSNKIAEKHSGRYAFFHAVQSNLFIAGLGFLLFFVFIDIVLIVNGRNIFISGVIFYLYNKNFTLFFMIISTLLSILTAVNIFGFVHHKRSSDMFFSLGIRRRTLFTARFAAGLLMVFLPMFLALSISLACNVFQAGFNGRLLMAYGAASLGFGIFTFVVYAVAVCVCVNTGTVWETVCFTVILLFGMQILTIGVNSYAMDFLHGNAMGVVAENGNRYGALSLSERLKEWIPLKYFYDRLFHLGFLNDYGDMAFPFSKYRDFVFESFPVDLLWLAASCALRVLSGCLFQKRKAENAGILGKNRTLNMLCTFILVFISSCFYGTNQRLWVVLAVGTGISLFVFCVCQFLLSWQIRTLWRSFIYFPLMMCFPWALIILFTTGCFGYSGRLPDIGDIETAYITYQGAQDYIAGPGELSVRYYGSQDSYERYYGDILFKTPEDIRVVYELQREIINAGAGLVSQSQTVEDYGEFRVNANVMIKYRLKNGEIFTRYYNEITARELQSMLSLDETDEIQNRIAESFHRQMEKEEPGTHSLGGALVVTDRYFRNITNIEDILREGLMNALYEDISRLSLKDRYYPEKQAVAMVIFQDNHGGRMNQLHPNMTGGVRDIFSLSPTNARFAVTEDYTDTLAFLREYDLLPPDTGTGVPEGIEQMAVARYCVNGRISGSQYFRSYMAGDRGRRDMVKSDVSVIIPESLYGEVLRLARNNYYTVGGGYMVMLKISEEEWGEEGQYRTAGTFTITGNSELSLDWAETETWLMLFLSEKDLTDELRELLRDVK